MIPLVAGTLHALGDHKHEICFSKNEHHFHQKDYDCPFYSIKNNNPLLTYTSYDLTKESHHSESKGIVKYFLTSHQQLSFSLRGPPQTTHI